MRLTNLSVEHASEAWRSDMVCSVLLLTLEATGWRQELEQAVMESNKSLSAAAAREAEKQVQQVLSAAGEAPEEAMAPGGYPARGVALGGPRKTVHFSDDETDAPAVCQNRRAPAGADAPDLATPPRGHAAEAAAGSRLGDETARSQVRCDSSLFALLKWQPVSAETLPALTATALNLQEQHVPCPAPEYNVVCWCSLCIQVFCWQLFFVCILLRSSAQLLLYSMLIVCLQLFASKHL